MTGLIVIHLILSMIVGKIAQDCGKSGVVWFFFAFFASPIVAGVVLFIMGRIDDGMIGLEKKIGFLQDQISDIQRMNDYKNTQIKEKIEAPDNPLYGPASRVINENRSLTATTDSSRLIEEKYMVWEKIMDLKMEAIDLNCPIRLSYGQIRRDRENNKNFMILDFFNVGERVVDGVKIKLKHSKNSDTEFEDEIFFYQYVKASRLQHFGINDPIEIRKTLDEKHISVKIDKILFADGTTWMSTGSSLYTSEIDDRQLKVLREIEGEDVLRLAKLEEENWYCVCGKNNIYKDEKCQLCSRWKDYVLDKYLYIEKDLVVNIDKYINAIEGYENIEDIKNTIKEMNEEGILEEKIVEEIHEDLNKYHHIQRVYGASKNDLDIARKKVLKILKNI